MSVSPTTVQHATHAINALHKQNIAIEEVTFVPDTDSYLIELADGGLIGPSGVGGGTIKNIEDEDDDPSPSGVGGGTVKSNGEEGP